MPTDSHPGRIRSSCKQLCTRSARLIAVVGLTNIIALRFSLTRLELYATTVPTPKMSAGLPDEHRCRRVEFAAGVTMAMSKKG